MTSKQLQFPSISCPRTMFRFICSSAVCQKMMLFVYVNECTVWFFLTIRHVRFEQINRKFIS